MQQISLLRFVACGVTLSLLLLLIKNNQAQQQGRNKCDNSSCYHSYGKLCGGPERGRCECGNCICTEDWWASDCSCSRSGSACIAPGGNGTECSGMGTCVCGVCECNWRTNAAERIYGTYCECDDFSCPRANGKLCNGPEHGKCNCGICLCYEDWTGEGCSCPTSHAPCFAPGQDNGPACSCKGVCECGVCKCNASYHGKFCEECQTCPITNCDTYKDCVQCQMYATGRYSVKECAANCTDFISIPSKVIEVDENNNEVRCAFYDEDECLFTFVYYHKEDGSTVVRAQQERECPRRAFPWSWIIGV